MNTPPVTPDRISELGKAFRASKALFSAVELGIFTVLAKGSRDLEELRADVGIAERGARDFFDSLVALRLLERDADNYYSNGPEAALYLDRGMPTYIGGELGNLDKHGYPHWQFLTEALKTGKPQSIAAAGNYFLDLYSDQSVLATYAEGMTGGSRIVAAGIVTKFAWHRYRTVIDIGASQGALLVEIARTHAHITGGGFDLPPLRPSFERSVEKHGLSQRLSFHAGDFLREPLPGADVLIIGRVLHNWDVSIKKTLIEKAFKALRPGGALIVYERMIDDERRRNAPGLLASLNMLIMTAGGFDFTAADCIGWMRVAGFHDIRVRGLPGGMSMITGAK